MLVFEFKAYGKSTQFSAVNEAIRTAQFVRNSCLRYWMDNQKMNKNDLNKYCAILASDFPFADNLTRWQDLPVQSEHGLLSHGFTITARRMSLVKKDIHNFRKIAVRWNIKPVAGSLLMIGSLSTLPIKKELDD